MGHILVPAIEALCVAFALADLVVVYPPCLEPLASAHRTARPRCVSVWVDHFIEHGDEGAPESKVGIVSRDRSDDGAMVYFVVAGQPDVRRHVNGIIVKLTGISPTAH